MFRLALALLALLVGSLAQADVDDSSFSRTIIGGSNEHLVAAVDALRLGDADSAIHESLLGLDGAIDATDRVGALSNLCAAYMLAEEVDLAIARCSDALAIRPDWHAYHNRALAYMRKHELDAAARDIDAGFAMFPDSKLLARAREALEALRHTRRPPPITVTAAAW